jgi:hypothetical protein
MIEREREWAESLLTSMDVSSFGGGWAFVLEFTTIIFIIFAVLTLGLLGVLSSAMIRHLSRSQKLSIFKAYQYLLT